MTFEALYYGDRLRLLNPQGDVGIVTLWSQVESAVEFLKRQKIEMSAETSRVAVVANLYGNGLPEMLRNLLWNPQIRYLIILGQDLSGSKKELLNFFACGLEQVEYLGSAAHRIVGTQRIIDAGVTPQSFREAVTLFPLGILSDAATGTAIQEIFAHLPASVECTLERQNIPIPENKVERWPSNPLGHNIVRPAPLDAWEELVFRLVRFGHRTKLRKGDRIELLNVKVTIQEPVEDADEDLEAYGFSAERFRVYQQSILDAYKAPDQAYSYGNRLRGYFQVDGHPLDSIEIVVDRLREDPESRHAYITLWDNTRDLWTGEGCPCFVSLFFRRFEGKLTMTATFRTHNAMSAWLQNVYGLIAIQRYVADRTGMDRGPITVMSHSISVDPAALDRAVIIARNKKSDQVVDRRTGKIELRFDPNGEFTLTIDKKTHEILVQHSYKGSRISEYRGKTAEAIEQQLARDVAISEISHALYLGRELAKKEFELKALLKAEK